MLARLQPPYRTPSGGRTLSSASSCVLVLIEVMANHQYALQGPIIHLLLERQRKRTPAATHALTQIASTTNPDRDFTSLTRARLTLTSSRRMYGEKEIVFTMIHPRHRLFPLGQRRNLEQATWKRWNPIKRIIPTRSKHRGSSCPRRTTITVASVKERGGCRLAIPRVE